MGRTLSITGAASGMGLAISRRLAEQAIAVALLDRDGEAASKRRRAARGRRAGDAAPVDVATARPSTR